jgi:hypothetical protein
MIMLVENMYQTSKERKELISRREKMEHNENITNNI